MTLANLFRTPAKRELLLSILVIAAGIAVMVTGNFAGWLAFSGFGGGLIFASFFLWLHGAVTRQEEIRD